MVDKTETTRVNLKYAVEQTPGKDVLDTTLLAALDLRGYRVRGVRALAGGARLEVGDLTLTVTRSFDEAGDIRVLAFGPDDGSPGSARAKARFRLCADVAREIATSCPPSRIEWRHRGGFYISEGGQIAVVSGMRGTSGLGARRKAAARAVSLYGHDARRRGARKAKAVLPFRIGGHGRRSLPVKLAQYAVNATICVFSLPFGAALMTYDLLHGGSLGHSARWVALAALALAFVDLEQLQRLSHLF